MTRSSPSILARQSTAKIGLFALGLILLAVAIAAYPSYRFVRGFTMGTLHPVAEFDSNEPFSLVDDDPYTAYYLSMSVDARDSVLPEMEIAISNADGEVIGDPINRWNSVMGREYKQFMMIPRQEDGKLTVEVTTAEHEDMLIYRKFEDVFAREIARARVFWMISLLPLLGAVGLLLVILVRAVNSSSKVELHVSK